MKIRPPRIDDWRTHPCQLELRDVLCPEGLKGIIKSYVDEAGAPRLFGTLR